MKRFAVLLALVVVSAAGSLLTPSSPGRPPTRVGRYLALEGDLHVHTSFVGAVATPVDILLLARRRELDFVAVTEHNAWFGGALTRWLGGSVAPEVVVLPSEELTNRGYHALAIGLSSRIDPRLPLSVIAADVHAQGGLLIAAHPTRDTWPLLLGLAASGGLDGAELFHPTMLRHAAIAADYAAFAVEATKASGHSLLAIGTSDYHGGPDLGRLRTVVLAESNTPASIMAALRANRAVAATPDGRLAGDPTTLEALHAAGYVSRAVTLPPVAARGWTARTLSILGLLVMTAALFRRRLLGIR